MFVNTGYFEIFDMKAWPGTVWAYPLHGISHSQYIARDDS